MPSIPCGSFGELAPDQVLRVTYENCGPSWMRPFGPWYRRYQKPAGTFDQHPSVSRAT